MKTFDPEKMGKLPKSHRFFDVNDLWYFANVRMVRWLFNKPISANQITLLSLSLGVLSVCFYLSSNSKALVFGALCLYGKLFFDNVDGMLARARGETSRIGRFFDSFVDFVINVAIYTALSAHLFRQTGQMDWWAIGFFALLSCFIHCSLFVFYLVQYTARVGSYDKNRVREKVTKEDGIARKKGEMSALQFFLQKFHQFAYDWQDALIERLDNICRRLANVGSSDEWYLDKKFLVLAGPLCLCTNTMALIVFSLFECLDVCFLLVATGGNVYMAGIVIWKTLRFRKSSLLNTAPLRGR